MRNAPTPKLCRTLLAACLLAPINDARAQLASSNVRETPNAERLEVYVGANARWLVDLQRDVVSAWEPSRDVPLWSRDGVVFRLSQRPTDVFSTFKLLEKRTPQPAAEFFGRVYFFLDDALIALDPRAQGRLVWKRRPDDFALFFTRPDDSRPVRHNVADATSAISFIKNIRPLTNDRLLIQARRGREIQDFIIDAASGEFSPLSRQTP